MIIARARKNDYQRRCYCLFRRCQVYHERRFFQSQAEFDNISNTIGGKLNTLADLLSKILEKPSEGEVASSTIGKSPVVSPNPSSSFVEKAAKAQEEAGVFEPKDVHMTPVDPFVRNKKELAEYATEADNFISKGEFTKVREAFDEDFYFWTGTHSKILPKELPLSLRDYLIQDGAPVWK